MHFTLKNQYKQQLFPNAEYLNCVRTTFISHTSANNMDTKFDILEQVQYQMLFQQEPITKRLPNK